MFRKNKLAMLLGEFIGTGALTLTVLSMAHSAIGQQIAFFIAVPAGLLLALMVLALAGISGAVFNPAITIGLWTVRKLQTLQAIGYILMQFLGAAAAWYLFVYLTKIDTSKVEFKMDYDPRVLVAETVGTFIFAFSIAAAIYQRLSLGVKAFAIGGGLTVGALAATLASAGILNPAVAWSLHQFGWGTYVAGPILGAILGFNLYNILFVQTELAEIATFKSEKQSTSKLKPGLTHSLVASEVDAEEERVAAKAKVSTVKAKATSVKKKTAVRKKTTTRSRVTR